MIELIDSIFVKYIKINNASFEAETYIRSNVDHQEELYRF